VLVVERSEAAVQRDGEHEVGQAGAGAAKKELGLQNRIQYRQLLRKVAAQARRSLRRTDRLRRVRADRLPVNLGANRREEFLRVLRRELEKDALAHGAGDSVTGGSWHA